MNIWDALSLSLESPRNNVLSNYDIDIPYVSYIKDQWKYVNGTTSYGKYDSWLDDIDHTEKHESFQMYGESVLNSVAGKILSLYSKSHVLFREEEKISSTEIEQLRLETQVKCEKEQTSDAILIPCYPLDGPCLFDIVEDPCERNNIALSNLQIVQEMEQEIKKFSESAVLPRNKPSDPRSNPINFNNTWTWWYDELGLDDDGRNIAIKPIQLSVTFYFIILFAIVQN